MPPVIEAAKDPLNPVNKISRTFNEPEIQESNPVAEHEFSLDTDILIQ